MKKNYTINMSVSRATFWKRVVPISVIVIIVGGLCGMFFVDRIVMTRIVNISSRGVVLVPSVISRSFEEGREVLYKKGLRLEVQDREYCDTFMKDIVINQRPVAGESVKKGRHILVTLSKGKEISTLPDVKKLNERAARKVLRDAGFDEIKLDRDFDDRIEKDLIIRTKPESGTKTSREIPVELFISMGARPTSAIVPNVIGELLSDAKDMIEKGGLMVGRVDYTVGTKSKPGLIISQSFSPGAKVPLKSPVNLIVAASK
jgi:serine/threonine-protein kinase